MTADAAVQQQPAVGQQPGGLQALAAVQAAALLLAEHEAAQAASWPLRMALAGFARQARSRLLVAQMSGLDDRQARAELARQLLAVADVHLAPATIVPVLRQAAARGAEQGSPHAAAQITLQRPGMPGVPTVPEPASRLVDAVARAARDTAQARIDKAAQLLAESTSPADVENALTAANGAPAHLSMGAEWLLNYAANGAARAAAIRNGARLLWIAERDACVVCAALSGHVANVLDGEGFDEDATFGPHRPAEPWPHGQGLTGPPRHPNCRCQCVVYFGAAVGQPDLPAALRREAKRSILRGFSLPSEPQRTRIVAADRLLASGSGDMPKSVRAYAAHAVQRGRFPTRDVPRYVSQPRRAA
jgi:hypothetical protein